MKQCGLLSHIWNGFHGSKYSLIGHSGTGLFMQGNLRESAQSGRPWQGRNEHNAADHSTITAVTEMIIMFELLYLLETLHWLHWVPWDALSVLFSKWTSLEAAQSGRWALKMSPGWPKIVLVFLKFRKKVASWKLEAIKELLAPKDKKSDGLILRFKFVGVIITDVLPTWGLWTLLMIMDC